MKKIIIIGSGIAGLSAGIYSRLNGYDAEIYEMGSNPGGLCTAWKRKNFTFDGCIHWLTGTDPASEYYHLWKETGGIDDKKFFYYQYFLKVRDVSGKYFTFYNDPHLLRNELLTIAPEDRKMIQRLTDDLRILMMNELPVEFTFRKMPRLFRIMRILFRYRMTAKEFSKKFRNSKIRDLIANHMDWHGMSVGFSFWAVAMMARKFAGYPLGGSRAFTDSVVNKFESLGGKIIFNARVRKILTLNGMVTGIRLDDGREIPADIVISAADGHTTLFEMLEGKYLNNKIRKLYRELVPFPSLLMVYLGVRGDYASEYHDYSFELGQPVTIGGCEIKSIPLKIYNFDPSLAPEGKCVFMIMLTTNYDYWKALRDRREAYIQEKQKSLEMTISLLSQIYPDLPERIETTDVVTPLTFERYTGNWRGSYQGWVLNYDSFTKIIPQTLPGLRNFYMAGHWVTPGGGLPSGVITARKAVKMICREDKKDFTAG